MTIVRRLARPLLAASFVQEGLDAVTASRQAHGACAAARRRDRRAAGAPEGPGAAHPSQRRRHGGCGRPVQLGRLPRLTSLALAATVAPGIYLHVASLRAEKDVDLRRSERDDLMRDLGRLGGALLASVDTRDFPRARLA